MYIMYKNIIQAFCIYFSSFTSKAIKYLKTREKYPTHRSHAHAKSKKLSHKFLFLKVEITADILKQYLWNFFFLFIGHFLMYTVKSSNTSSVCECRNWCRFLYIVNVHDTFFRSIDVFHMLQNLTVLSKFKRNLSLSVLHTQGSSTDFPFWASLWFM